MSRMNRKKTHTHTHTLLDILRASAPHFPSCRSDDDFPRIHALHLVGREGSAKKAEDQGKWTRQSPVAMRLPRDRTLISGILIFCFICCFLFQICIEIGLENQQQPGAVSLDADEPRTPNLGVVVPLRAEEIHSAVDSIKRWPTTCSGITLKSVDLIFYFAREIPQELERHLRRASDAISCFRKTRVVTAALRPEVRCVIVISSMICLP